jgi:hypothetical protein
MRPAKESCECGEVIHRWPNGQSAGRCKSCHNEGRKQYYLDNWHNTYAHHQNKRHPHPGLDGDHILALWGAQNAECWYCSKEMKCPLSPGWVSKASDSVSVDHVVPGVYEKDNLVLSCLGCNVRKRDGQKSDFENFLGGIAKWEQCSHGVELSEA